MSMSESYELNGGRLRIARQLIGGEVEELTLTLERVGTAPQLHWGLTAKDERSWQRAPEACWPAGSTATGSAVQSPFIACDAGWQLRLTLPDRPLDGQLRFVIALPSEGVWLKHQGNDFSLALPNAASLASARAHARLATLCGTAPQLQRSLSFGEAGTVELALVADETSKRLFLVGTLEGTLLLHWGLVARCGRGSWRAPSLEGLPPGSRTYDAHAVQTPLRATGGLAELVLEFDPAHSESVAFVLCQELGSETRWLKEQGRDSCVPLVERAAEVLESGPLEDLYETIISHERERGSWTLMHRYNLACGLLEPFGGTEGGRALLYCWLRYSALRQLTWQRRYNTKPRELAHAQDRLTQAIARAWRATPAGRLLFSMMLASLGRGSNGQRVRDEILEIMHRHRIKEVSGHFMEEWHQKLHNNTTYDDVVICEGYLAFLRADGDRGAFYRHLAANGIDRERLAHLERPIVSEPDFVPYLKQGLLHDFEHYLLTLKRVHQGADLQVALESAMQLLEGRLQRLVQSIQHHERDTGTHAVEQAKRISQARGLLRNQLLRNDTNDAQLRDLLFLDQALQESARVLVERIAGPLALDDLVQLAAAALDDVVRLFDDEELGACSAHLSALLGQAMSGVQRERALALHAVFERIARGLSSQVMALHAALAGPSRRLGEALEAAPWTVDLFVEEAIRGVALFPLSATMGRLAPRLRAEANIGDWQVIHPGNAAGAVAVVPSLLAHQETRFPTPTILFAREVIGSEEIPAGVVAVLTRSSVDLVSHVAVRARDANILFASCYDDGSYEAFARPGAELCLFSTAAGEIAEGSAEGEAAAAKAPTPAPTGGAARPAPASALAPSCDDYAIGLERFQPGWVGAKSLNIRRLWHAARSWPPGAKVPASLALPFGSAEKVLALPGNGGAAARYREGLAALSASPLGASTIEPILVELRAAIDGLEAPPALLAALHREVLSAHLPNSFDDREAWRCIKEVWASKWTLRATLSRASRGIAHASLQMAVLVQPVVPADCAFVLHTVDPRSADHAMLYGELVVGLGETLVSNAPGRAMAFVAPKGGGPAELLSFPSKSLALRGGGLIFRSDSSGEDLAGYAGAGLYDSIPLPTPRSERVDYSRQRLTNERAYLHELLGRLTALGTKIEAEFEGPQDIEGAVAGDEIYIVQTRPQVGL